MPKRITADGGTYYLKDKITTPDTMTAHFEFDDLPVDRLIMQMLGTIGPLVRQSMIGQEDLRLDFSVVTSTA